jgi:hypothetical protein
MERRFSIRFSSSGLRKKKKAAMSEKLFLFNCRRLKLCATGRYNVMHRKKK